MRTDFITDIGYDAKGQRVAVRYGNGTRTDFGYDTLTFRVMSRKTTRGSDQAVLQDLAYAYDPAGNITRVADAAQQTLYFNNQVVTPSRDFTYDALYRLISAAGREQIGQATAARDQLERCRRVQLPHLGDGQAMAATSSSTTTTRSATSCRSPIRRPAALGRAIMPITRRA